MKKLAKTLLILILFYPIIARAAQLDDIIDEQNRIIQNQQQFEQNKLRQNELKSIEFERQKLEKEESGVAEKFVDEKCLQIIKISFTKNKILSRKEEKLLVAEYLNQCLTSNQINKLTNDISNYLVKKGHATSKAIVKREADNGELLIEIIEGYMEDIIFNDDGFLDKMQKFSAFGLVKKDEILNLQDIESGLEQINRLASNKAVIKIFAGAKKDSSIIAIKNNPKGRVRINFGFDDLGSNSTGKHRDTIGVSFDNLLHLNDNFNISRSANDLTKKKEEGRSSSVNLSWSLPFKNNVLTLSSVHYSYSLLQGQTVRFKAYGQSVSNSFSLDSKLIKRPQYRLNSNINLVERNIENYTGDVKLETSSRRSSVGTFALANTFFFNQATLFLKPSFSKGLKILNARQDGDNLPSQAAHAQFEVFRLYANYSQNLEIPRAKIPFIYSLTFDSQFSRQELYSNDQFFVGGPYTVRGFENGSIAGDSGYGIKNELKFNLGKVVTQISKIEKLQWLNNVSITPFYDYGSVRVRGGLRSGSLSGGGFKTSFNHKNLTANLTYAWVVNKSQLLQDKYSENQAVYFDIATEFGFF